MCGRYASIKDPGALAVEFDAVDATGTYSSEAGYPAADYNVAPMKSVFGVVQRHPRDADGNRDMDRTERTIRVMRWGLVPKWAKDPAIGNRMINARAETVTSKPAFRGPIKHSRCLLPADGWYEWQRGTTPKQPYFMTPGDGSSLALAGIWTTWWDPRAEGDAQPLVSCAVLTTEAVGPLAEVHERMPMVVPDSAWRHWLDPDLQDVSALLGPPPGELLGRIELRPVSRAVNNVRNNGAGLVERVAGDEPVPWEREPGEPSAEV
ncbi:SOS response-associated peptidase [Halopolyspora algeriensis]|uniref:SOS response-associated peptidase n=1 Tax=Halopolyspora algeriensis TaxID=1500506 RepID=UPI000DF26B0F|nr:SOS response-associated peptidase [Halopolyspora algeriensis]